MERTERKGKRVLAGEELSAGVYSLTGGYVASCDTRRREQENIWKTERNGEKKCEYYLRGCGVVECRCSLTEALGWAAARPWWRGAGWRSTPDWTWTSRPSFGKTGREHGGIIRHTPLSSEHKMFNQAYLLNILRKLHTTPPMSNFEGDPYFWNYTAWERVLNFVQWCCSTCSLECQ